MNESPNNTSDIQPSPAPGQVPPGYQPSMPYVPVIQPKTSGMAVASLVLGIVGTIFCAVASLVGLILGIVSLNTIKISAGQLTGRGLAIAGIVTSSVSIMLGLLMLTLPLIGIAVSIPWMKTFTQGTVSSQQIVGESNMSQLCLAAALYSNENAGLLPDPDAWQEQLQPYVPDIDELTSSPFDPDVGRLFAMNAYLIGSSAAQPLPVALTDIPEQDRTVLFFEVSSGSPSSGGPELLPAEPQGPDGCIIGFADGHVEVIPPEQIDDLIWNDLPSP